MGQGAVLGFLVAVLPLVVTPGASFTLATQRVLAGQRGAVVLVVAGTATGIYCHALLAAAGLSAVVMRSAEAFTAVKVAGALYLVGLGLLTLTAPARAARARGRGRNRPAARLPWSGHRTYPQAVLANVLNPKAASVYLTLAPQFLTAQHVGFGPLLTLATVHVAAMAAWLTVWGLLLARGRRAVDRRRLRDVVDRVGGTLLIALGVRTAVAS